MQVKNQTIFMGDTSKSERRAAADGAQAASKNRGSRKSPASVFAGDLHMADDPIAMKRKAAQKKALKVVSDAFDKEVRLDEDMNSRRDTISRMRDVIQDVDGQLEELDERETKLKEIYGVTDDSPESAQNEEYQERLKELNDFRTPLEEKKNDAENAIHEETAVLRAMHGERLKHIPFAGENREAKEILDAAGDEILGMLFAQGREHIDEEHEESVREAEKEAEEKKEQEEQTEKIREKAQELQQFAEKVQGQASETKGTDGLDKMFYHMMELDQTKTDVQKEVENIVDQMKLVIEDIKGSQVDAKI